MRAVRSGTVDADGLAAVLEPRRGLVIESALGDGEFACETGPVLDYRRSVEVLATSGTETEVRQTVEFRLAIPYWGWIFGPPMRSQLARLGSPRRRPWWSPPDNFDARSATVLGCLAALSYVTGMTGVLLSQTLTFAADQFNSGTRVQGIATAAARLDVLVAIVLVAAADRRGRRAIVVLSALMVPPLIYLFVALGRRLDVAPPAPQG